MQLWKSILSDSRRGKASYSLVEIIQSKKGLTVDLNFLLNYVTWYEQHYLIWFRFRTERAFFYLVAETEQKIHNPFAHVSFGYEFLCGVYKGLYFRNFYFLLNVKECDDKILRYTLFVNKCM